MLKLCTTLVLGAFLIYGLDDLGVISAREFEVIENSPDNHDATGEANNKSTSRFTDRIVEKRKTQEGHI